VQRLVVVEMLPGCFGGSGGDYIGKWVGVRRTQVTLAIERNGDGSFIRETATSRTAETSSSEQTEHRRKKTLSRSGTGITQGESQSCRPGGCQELKVWFCQVADSSYGAYRSLLSGALHECWDFSEAWSLHGYRATLIHSHLTDVA
jgi:hypothetical protein